MDKRYILYNPFAGNNNGLGKARAIETMFPHNSFQYADITRISDICSFIGRIPEDAQIIIAGGDGTLNRLVNDIGDKRIRRELYYCACGSGNDFMADLNRPAGGLVLLNPYIENLPTVTVNGKKSRFINGVGYGIDGYCCEVGDELRKKSDKPVKYSLIAIKGLLFHFKPANAKVTVDGKVHTYKNVWLAPTMNGRYYGGGMMVAPEQNRLNEKGTLSVAVMHGSGKLKTLAVFPSIFKGEHIKHTEMVEVLTGHEIKVEFDRPMALQIDGETVKGVVSYCCTSEIPAVSPSL